MLPEAYITHCSANRLRIRVPAHKGDKTFFSVLKERLQSYPGIEKLEINPLTGSLLLHHRMDLKAFTEHAARQRMFALNPARVASVTLQQRLLQPLHEVNRTLQKLTGGEIDLGSIAFVGLVGMGIYQISRGNFKAPAWYTAFWYATNLASKAQPPEQTIQGFLELGGLQDLEDSGDSGD
jgi:hypothetical protein